MPMRLVSQSGSGPSKGTGSTQNRKTLVKASDLDRDAWCSRRLALTEMSEPHRFCALLVNARGVLRGAGRLLPGGLPPDLEERLFDETPFHRWLHLKLDRLAQVLGTTSGFEASKLKLNSSMIEAYAAVRDGILKHGKRYRDLYYALAQNDPDVLEMWIEEKGFIVPWKEKVKQE